MNPRKNTISTIWILIVLSYLLLHAQWIQAQESFLVTGNPDKKAFSLTNCSIMYDEADFTVVRKTTDLFAKDIEAVTGNRPKVVTQKVQGNIILMGTVGKSKLIDQLVSKGKLDMQTFFDFAWDVNQYDFEKINHHQSQFLAGIFGAKYEKTFQDILDTYYRLTWSRKPEFMGWEREWDAPQYREVSNTDFSFQNYNDAQQRLADYKRISDLADEILNELPENYRPPFFELVAYPVMGSYQMNRKFLLAQLNHELIKENNLPSAKWAAEQARTAFDSINSLTEKYNTMLDGKWNGMMKLAPGWVAKYQNMPEVVCTEGAGKTSVDLTPQESENQLKGCTVIDLTKFKNKVSKSGHTLRLIEGIGYDWKVIQLGEASEQTVDPSDLNGTRFEYEFPEVNADSVTVYVYSLPLFPLYQGKSTQYGISVDGQSAFIAKDESKEFSRQWKDRVLQNGTVTVAKFPVKQANKKHTLTLTCGDPGMIIQRIVIDWGGLKDCYVGPSASF